MSFGIDTTNASNLKTHAKARGKTGVQHGRSILDAILTHPGSICDICQKEMFRNSANSGLRSWLSGHQETTCPVCIYARNLLDARKIRGFTSSANGDAIFLHWSRRTMGRTSNTRDHLALTLKGKEPLGQGTYKRFIFMFKSDLGSIPGKRELGNSTRLEDAGPRIKQWLQTCRTKHVHCNHRKSKTTYQSALCI